MLSHSGLLRQSGHGHTCVVYLPVGLDGLVGPPHAVCYAVGFCHNLAIGFDNKLANRIRRRISVFDEPHNFRLRLERAQRRWAPLLRL